MRVWLAEKSSFANELAKVLGAPKRVSGLAHGWDTNGGRVLYAAGHLISIAEPHEYDEKYRTWELGDLPILPNPFKFSVIEGKEKWYNAIEQGIKGATEVVVATDAGREGEYIAWLILAFVGYRGPLRRMWSSGANAASIRKAVGALLPYSVKQNLATAAQIRAESDWIEGLNLTRVFTKKFAPSDHDKPISAGRVQTATLALIVRRAREIETFKSTPYYEVEAQVQAAGHVVKMAHRPPPEKRITDFAEAQRIAVAANGANAPVEVTKQEQSRKPPPLFESSSLQIRAHNLWGWSASKTEEIAQALYDEHKLISYPRTDGIYLEDDQVGDVNEILNNILDLKGQGAVALKDGAVFPDLSKLVPAQPIIRDDVFSSKKLAASGADHHGIIPTTEAPDLGALKEDERKLYLLIVRQFLAQFHPDCRYEQVSMRWLGGERVFTASGRTILEPGWQTLFGAADAAAEKDESDGEDDDGVLPPIPDRAMGRAIKALPIQKMTKAPKWFTEGSIVAAMRNLSTVVTDPAAREMLRHAGSIGTKSTWGTTISKLKEREYILPEKGALKPTTLGRSLVEFCEKNVPQLVDPVSTAQLEMMLQGVEKGELDQAQAKRVLLTRNVQAIRHCLDLPEERLRGNVAKGLARAAKKNDDRRGRAPAPFVPPEGGIIELDVPYGQNEAAKAVGARFNPESKRWWVPKVGADVNDLKRRNLLKEEAT